MIDIAIFVVFLTINLIVGLRYARRASNLREYALGNKDFSTGALTATIVATWSSGSTLFIVITNTYNSGLYYLIARIGLPLGILITAQLAKRMEEFLDNISIAEAMGDMYGRVVRVVTATCGILSKISYAAVQFNVMAEVLATIFNLQNIGATIIAAWIVIVYSSLGGIKAVTFTDVLQFFTFGTIIPVLALTIWNNMQDPGTQLVAMLANNPKFHIKKVVGLTPDFMNTLALVTFYCIPGLAPEIFQRIAMAKNSKQAKHALTYASGLFLLLFLLMSWIGLLLLADKPGLGAKQVVSYMINNYTYVGMKGLLTVGVMALAMSTADSIINTTAVLFANDIFKPLTGQKTSSVRVARLFALVIGLAALCLALYSQDLLALVLLSGSLYMPIFTVPMLMAVLGFRSTTRVVLIAKAAGFITVVLWSIWVGNSSSIFPGVLANLLALLGSHYLLREPGGWQRSKAQAPQTAMDRRPLGQRIAQRWRTTLQTIHPLAYLQKNLPYKSHLYPLFGFYLLISTYVLLYNLPKTAENEYLLIYRAIQYSVLAIATALVAYPIWPQSMQNKRLLAWLWPAIICYTLFFVGGVLVIMGESQPEQVLILMLNMVMASLILRWPFALSLALGGTIASVLLFHWGLGNNVLGKIATNISFKIAYGLLLFSSFLIVLFKNRQFQARLASYNDYLLQTQQATRQELVKALNYREELLQELHPEEIAMLDSTTTAYIKQAIYRVKNYLRLEVSQIDLSQLINAVKSILRLQGLDLKLHVHQNTQQAEIQADASRIKQLLANSILYVYRHSAPDSEVSLMIEDTLLGHEIAHMKNYTRKLEALRFTITTEQSLPPLAPIYTMDPIHTQVPQGEEELILTEHARIMDAHYGFLDMSQSTTHIYVLPTRLRAVRGKVMELLGGKAAADPAELAHPLTIQLEKDLMTRLEGTQVDLAVIGRAIDTIKKYHGGTKRKSGEPFLTHPMQVALILLEHSQDQDAIVAALLHDTVEDTSLSIAHISATFGETVASLVAEVTNLEDKLRRISLESHENHYRLLHCKDLRAALVKLSDRLHNMRTIQGHPSVAKQKKIAHETLTFFVPMASKLQLQPIADELERLSLSVLGSAT